MRHIVASGSFIRRRMRQTSHTTSYEPDYQRPVRGVHFPRVMWKNGTITGCDSISAIQSERPFDSGIDSLGFCRCGFSDGLPSRRESRMCQIQRLPPESLNSRVLNHLGAVRYKFSVGCGPLRRVRGMDPLYQIQRQNDCSGLSAERIDGQMLRIQRRGQGWKPKGSESAAFRKPRRGPNARPDSTGTLYRESYIGHGCKFSVENPALRFDFSVDSGVWRFDFSEPGDSKSASVSKRLASGVAESAWKTAGLCGQSGATRWSPWTPLTLNLKRFHRLDCAGPGALR